MSLLPYTYLLCEARFWHQFCHFNGEALAQVSGEVLAQGHFEPTFRVVSAIVVEQVWFVLIVVSIFSTMAFLN